MVGTPAFINSVAFGIGIDSVPVWVLRSDIPYPREPERSYGTWPIKPQPSLTSDDEGTEKHGGRHFQHWRRWHLPYWIDIQNFRELLNFVKKELNRHYKRMGHSVRYCSIVMVCTLYGEPYLLSSSGWVRWIYRTKLQTSETTWPFQLLSNIRRYQPCSKELQTENPPPPLGIGAPTGRRCSPKPLLALFQWKMIYQPTARRCTAQSTKS